jgi:hypothetical protein
MPAIQTREKIDQLSTRGESALRILAHSGLRNPKTWKSLRNLVHPKMEIYRKTIFIGVALQFPAARQTPMLLFTPHRASRR